MEMHQIRSFLAVAEDLNFTHAAERCNVAQPSISRAIKMLEVELGGPLFHRERTNTHLSELGRIMKPPRSPAVGALVMEAMRCNWVEPALAVRHMSNNRQDGPGSGDFLSVGDS